MNIREVLWFLIFNFHNPRYFKKQNRGKKYIRAQNNVRVMWMTWDCGRLTLDIYPHHLNKINCFFPTQSLYQLDVDTILSKRNLFLAFGGLAKSGRSRRWHGDVFLRDNFGHNICHKIWSQNFGHQALVTKFWSQNIDHKVFVTKFWSQNFSHKVLVTKF